MIHHGDLFDVLPTLEAESVDACVTDPPYGIGFMGRAWDTFKPGTGKHRRLMHPRERVLGKIVSDNPNTNGRWRSPALSPSQIEYDYSAAGLRAFQDWTAQWSAGVLRVLKPGAYIVVCGAPRSHHRMMCGLEDAGFVVRDCIAWLFGSGFPKNRNLGDGRGSALKPAHEPIALAWKPFKGSLTANVAGHGTGALNINACRLEAGAGGYRGDEPSAKRRYADTGGTNFAMQPGPRGGSELGRWPPNVALDEDAAADLDEQTGELVSGFMPAGTQREGLGYHGGLGAVVSHDTIGDRGGASRFFYCAKPDREERDFGCHALPLKTADPYAEHRGRRMPDGSDRFDGKPASVGRNIHPTVKPVALMRWLVRLVTPPNGLVLDPFTGSGTTGMACRYEQRRFIGIEREAEYVAIAERRIAAVAPLFAESVTGDLSSLVLEEP